MTVFLKRANKAREILKIYQIGEPMEMISPKRPANKKLWIKLRYKSLITLILKAKKGKIV